MTINRMSYCQSCIRAGVELKLEDVGGRPFWLCEKCLNPLPREAYDKKSRKPWGETRGENKGTNR